MKTIKNRSLNKFLIAMILLVAIGNISSENILRINVSSTGEQTTVHTLSRPSISDDGRFIVFSSKDANLVENDNNDAKDVFLYDSETAGLRLISKSESGTPGNADSANPTISADGNFIVFNSSASNLVANDTNDYWDTFLVDRVNGIVTLVSKNASGTQGDQGFIQGVLGPIKNTDDVQRYAPSISQNGKYVVFTSDATNLVENDTNKKYDIFLADMQTGNIERISVSTDETQANNSSYNAKISGNGRYVVFNSAASNLVENDTNNIWDTFLRDRELGTTVRINLADNEDEANGVSISVPDISHDGQYAVFTSKATNLLENKINRESEIFLYNSTREILKCITLNNNNFPFGGINPAISSDGRYVLFSSRGVFYENIEAGIAQIYSYNIETDTLELISQGENGVGNAMSSLPTTSTNGVITFISLASNLVENDTNSKYDVFTLSRKAVTLLFPRCGEFLYKNMNYTIKWNSIEIASGIKIELLKNESFFKTITENTADDGIFEWEVSEELDADSDYKIKITSLDNSQINDINTAPFSISNSKNLQILPFPETAGTVTPEITFVPDGETVAITAIPTGNFIFSSWQIIEGDVQIEDLYSSETTVTLNGNAILTALFVESTTELTISPSDGGTTSPSSGSLSITPGMPQEITAISSENYDFAGWIIVSGFATIENPSNMNTTVSLSSNAQIHANFEKNTVQLTVSSENTEKGSVTPTLSSQQVSKNQPITITAHPTEGYHFSDWNISGNASLDDSTAFQTILLPLDDSTVTAIFEENSKTKPDDIYLSDNFVIENSPAVYVGYFVSEKAEDLSIFTISIIQDDENLFEIINNEILKLQENKYLEYATNPKTEITIRTVNNNTSESYDRIYSIYAINTIVFTPQKGWNLFSMPFVIKDVTPDMILIDESGDKIYKGKIWTWNNDSETMQLTVLENDFDAKKGFWLYSLEETVSEAIVDPEPLNSIEDLHLHILLKTGWNLIGVSSDTALPSDFSRKMSIWGWDGKKYFNIFTENSFAAWHVPGKLIEGYGYWIFSPDSKELYLQDL
ncbi:MAG: hypothetical protein U9O87_00435 [Verrucomicrobiota bacterium]|nr:hypothetical protein [Verrucomicrobiota bacterium]